MKYRGKDCASRAFSDAAGSGTEWICDGAVVAREYATRTKAPEDVAAEQAEAARKAREQARLAKLREIRDHIKAGSDTAAERAKALKLLIGVVMAIAAEDGE
jgi:hypothetical protein